MQTFDKENYHFKTIHLFLYSCVYRQARIDAELNNTSWRVRPEEVLVEVGTGLGASPALHSINEVLKVRDESILTD